MAVWSLALVTATGMLAAQYVEYRRCAQVRASGAYQLVEGKVTDFTALGLGPGVEQFRVGGVLFRFGRGDIGYHQAARDGGYIKPGAWVRIGYASCVISEKRNVILTLEIPRQE